MSQICMAAHAKINWALDITGVRDDGYHLVDMLLQSITLCDTVRLRHHDGLSLIAPGSPQGEGNIAWRAAMLLSQAAGVSPNAQIEIEKNIPSEAGLGGGSADAAAVLLGLNELWNIHFSMERLQELALRLGADVPFQLQGGLARAQGIGEKLTALPSPSAYLVLAKPAKGASTRAVYAEYDQMPVQIRPDIGAIASAIQTGKPFYSLLENVLEGPALGLVPDILPLMQALSAAGALCVRMTGSGSCVFGVFADEKAAQFAAIRLHAPFVAVCQTTSSACVRQ